MTQALHLFYFGVASRLAFVNRADTVQPLVSGFKMGVHLFTIEVIH